MMSLKKICLIPLFLVLILISIVAAAQSDYQSSATNYRYLVNTAIDPAGGTATGDVRIQTKNQSNSPVKRIYLSICNYARIDRDKPVEQMISDPSVNGKPVKTEWRLVKTKEDYAGVDLLLEDSIQPGAELEVAAKFSSGKFPYRYGFHQFIGDWFPMIVSEKDNKPDVNIHYLADFDLKIAYPAEYKAAFSGAIISRTEKEKTVTVRSTAEDISSFGVLLSKEFFSEEAESEGVQIISYWLKGDEKWGKKLLEYSKDIISFYKKEIGFYPQPVLYILPGYPDRPAGGYPICPNCIIIHRNLDSRGKDAELFATWITAHEIGHQYWGFGYIMEDVNYPRWFGLSMGIYTDRLYTDAKRMDDRAHKNFPRRYLGGVLAGVDTTIMQKVAELEKQDFDWNNVIAHGKSYTVLTLLEEYIGPDLFKKIFRECLKRYKGKVVTLDIFKSLCEEISGKDLGWFFHQWYMTNKYLDYRIASARTKKEADIYIVECKVECLGEAVMPLEIGLECTDGSKHIKEIDGWDRETILRFETKAGPVRVIIDPEEKLPLLSKAEQSPEIIRYALGELYLSKKLSLAPRLISLLGTEEIKDADYYYWSCLAKRYTGDYKGAIEAFQRLLSLKPDQLPDNVRNRAYIGIGMTHDLMGKRDDAVKYYKMALNHPVYKAYAEKYLKQPYNSFEDFIEIR